MAALVIIESSSSRKLKCTGSIVSKNHILTAAHCLLDVEINRIEIVLASVKPEAEYEEERVVKTIKDHWLHPKYVENQAYYDVAVLETNDDITFGKYIFPICLPSSGKPSEFRDGRPGAIVGYGPELIGNNVLLTQAQVTVNRRRHCESKYEDKGSSSKLTNFLASTLNEGFNDALICASNPVSVQYENLFLTE